MASINVKFHKTPASVARKSNETTLTLFADAYGVAVDGDIDYVFLGAVRTHLRQFAGALGLLNKQGKIAPKKYDQLQVIATGPNSIRIICPAKPGSINKHTRAGIVDSLSYLHCGMGALRGPAVGAPAAKAAPTAAA